MVHSGVLTPTINTTSSFNETSRYNVPFVVILEPLLFGVLPSSVVSTVFTILAIIVVGIPIARNIHCYLEGIAQQAKAEELLVGKEKDF